MFEDLANFVQDEIILPIKGKDYVVPPIDIELGAKVVRKWNLAQAIGAGVTLSDDELDELKADAKNELDLYKEVLGSAYDEMLTDQVGYQMMQRAGKTAIALVVSGAEAAAAQWAVKSVAGPGKALTTSETSTSTTTETSSSGSTTVQPSSEDPASVGPESSSTGTPS